MNAQNISCQETYVVGRRVAFHATLRQKDGSPIAKSASPRVVTYLCFSQERALIFDKDMGYFVYAFLKHDSVHIAEILARIPPPKRAHIKAICPPFFSPLIRKPFSLWIPIIAVLEPLPGRRLSPYRFPGVTPNSISRLSTGLRKNPDFLFVVN